MIRLLTRRHASAPTQLPRARNAVTFLRRSRHPEKPIYSQAATALKTRRHSDALAWIYEHLKPEAARMLETCLSAYGATEALRWVAYWEEKREPIGKEADRPCAAASRPLS